MDFQPWIGPLSLVATLAGIYYTRRQTKIMETQAAASLSRGARRRGETINLKWWKNPSIPVLFILSGLAWAPYIMSFNRENDPYATLFKSYLIESVGTITPDTAFMQINTKYLDKYKDDYKLVMVVTTPDPYVDTLADPDIERSGTYGITGERVTLAVRTTEKLRAKAFSVSRGFINMAAVVLPKKIAPDQIKTLSDVVSFGGVFVAAASTQSPPGPPGR
jgi:hypothetical protein